MSIVMNFAPLVEMMLFINSLTVSRSAVGVPALPGKCTLLPQMTLLLVFLGLYGQWESPRGYQMKDGASCGRI